MNFQQLSNLQYWTSLFSSPWSIAINLFDILIVTYVLYRFTKAIAGTKIMILVRGVLIFVLAQVVANILDLTTISWLIIRLLPMGSLLRLLSSLQRFGLVWNAWEGRQISFLLLKLVQKSK